MAETGLHPPRHERGCSPVLAVPRERLGGSRTARESLRESCRTDVRDLGDRLRGQTMESSISGLPDRRVDLVVDVRLPWSAMRATGSAVAKITYATLVPTLLACQQP